MPEVLELLVPSEVVLEAEVLEVVLLVVSPQVVEVLEVVEVVLVVVAALVVDLVVVQLLEDDVVRTGGRTP